MKTFLVIFIGLAAIIAGLWVGSMFVVGSGGLITLAATYGYHPEAEPRTEPIQKAVSQALKAREAKL